MKDKLINIVLLMQIIVTAIVIIPSDEQYNIIKNTYLKTRKKEVQ